MKSILALLMLFQSQYPMADKPEVSGETCLILHSLNKTVDHDQALRAGEQMFQGNEDKLSEFYIFMENLDTCKP